LRTQWPAASVVVLATTFADLLPGIEPLATELLAQIREMARRPISPEPPVGGADRLPLLRAPRDW
jgi:hypothetical protein